jgi:alpha-beta hydrolase superfamily lysophospholipase
MHARANEAAFSLANLIRFIRRCTENRPIHIIAHSLGAKVALSVLAHLAPGDVGRMILLTGASHRADALRMLGSPAGRTVEVLNVTTRENDLFDLAFEQLVPGDGAIGRGLDGHNVLNL